MKDTHMIVMPKYDGTGTEEVQGDIKTLLKEAYARGIHNGARERVRYATRKSQRGSV